MKATEKARDKMVGAFVMLDERRLNSLFPRHRVGAPRADERIARPTRSLSNRCNKCRLERLSPLRRLFSRV